jgi:hypothetical protein
MLDTLLKARAVDAIAIAQEIPWSLVPGKGFDHLLRRPLGGRMLGDVEVYDTPPLMGEDDEDEEHAACHGRHRE